MQYFKPFETVLSSIEEDEYVLYVQEILLKDIEDEYETWHCMFTTKRFIICKENKEKIIINRKQLNYENIKNFKLKKNKRFKKSNLPSIKVYIVEKTSSGVNNALKKTISSKSAHDLTDNEELDSRPKIIFSFKDNELKEKFYGKMCDVIRDKSYLKEANNYTDICDIYWNLNTIIFRQNIYNEYLLIRDKSVEEFKFSNTILLNQIKQIININSTNNNLYAYKLLIDDIKHISAYYKYKQDNFQIRNNRKQWFINCYIITKLFYKLYFPIENISDESAWIWIKQICRSSIYFINDENMNKKCIWLMDILIKKCFNNKYIKCMDTFFHEKDYQNLQITYYLISNYISTHNIKKINLRFKQMIPLIIKNNHEKYFIQLINISQITEKYNENDIYQSIQILINNNYKIYNEKHILIKELIKLLKSNKKNINKIYPKNILYLQQIIKNGVENKENQQEILIKLKINLIINKKLLYQSYYDLTPLQFINKVNKKNNKLPKIASFLKNLIEIHETEHKEGYDNDNNTRDTADADADESISLSKHKIEIIESIPPPQSRSVTPQSKSITPQSSPQSWGFSNFVGQCLSFTQLTNTNNTNTGNDNNNSIIDDNNELKRRLQSYITALEKFKTKTRNLEHKIVKLNKSIDKQNEKIIELKLENKMLKNVFMNKNNNDNNSETGVSDTSCDDDVININYIQQKEWKKWSYLEIIYWICSLQNGRFKRYKNTLKINLKLRNIRGIHLLRMEKSDLTYFYGIVDFNDVSDLFKEIQNLIN